MLAIFDGFGLIKLDRDSNLIWANPARIHHDLFVDENGFIHTLSRQAKVIPRLHPVELVLEDFIVVLDINGNIVKKVSVLEAFERSPYASFLAKMERFGDVLHTNTIEILDGSHAARSPVLAKGNALISSPTTNAIAIVDMETESVVWALSGLWAAQHQPTLLANSNMLLFDNEGHFGMSKVVEFDPLTQEIRWLFGGNEVNGFLESNLWIQPATPEREYADHRDDERPGLRSDRGSRRGVDVLQPRTSRGRRRAHRDALRGRAHRARLSRVRVSRTETLHHGDG